MKNSFILYNSYREQIEMLSMEQRGKLLTAILKYSETNEIIELEPVVQMAFSFIKTNLDRDKDKWEEMAEVRSEAGRKGADARWKDHKKDSLDKKKIANDGNRILPMANDGKNAVNVNVNGNVNVSNISKDMVAPVYGNKDLISLKNFMINNYPKPLLGITDTRKLHNLKQIMTPRKNQDEWMDESWKENTKKFLVLYLDETEEKYLVNSIDKLREKAKLWREYRGKLS